MTEKNCTKCGELKPTSEFSIRLSHSSGFHPQCKKCVNLAGQLWYAANKNKKLSQNKQWREKNLEKHKELNRKWFNENKERKKHAGYEWHRKNPEKQKEYTKKYFFANREKCNKRTREWSKNNPDKANAVTAKRVAQKLKATPPWFEKEKVAFVYKKAQEYGFQVDHVIPLRGKNVCGLHCWSNLQLLDATLNRSKSNREYPDH